MSKKSKKLSKRMKRLNAKARKNTKKQNTKKSQDNIFERIDFEKLQNEIKDERFDNSPELYFEEVVEAIKEFNFADWALWINTASLHPKNQLMELRFQLLMGHLLTIKEDEFVGNALDYAAFRAVLKVFDAKCSSLKWLEDFAPLPQMQKIPLFFNRKIKYFFYGSFEQPYLHWRGFIDLFYPVLRLENNFLAFLIEQSLDMQTKLINSIEKYVDDCEVTQSIFVPPESFLEDISPLFKVEDIINNISFISCGELVEKKQLYTNIINENFLRDKFYINTSSNYCYLFPFNHIDAITQAIQNEIFKQKNINILSDLNQAACDYLQRAVYQASHISDAIEYFIEIPGTILTKEVDAIVELECNKFIIFKVTPYCQPKDFQQAAQDTINQLSKTIKSLKESNFLFKNYYNDSDPVFQPGEITEFYGVAVLNPISLDAIVFPDTNQDEIFCYQLSDICVMLETANSLKELLDFFKDENSINGIGIDALDRFTIYSQNKGFNTFGIDPMMFFVPHTGSKDVNEKLYEKYSDDIHYILYKHFFYRYNKVLFKKHIGYKVYDSINGAGGIALKFRKSLIFLKYPWNVVHNYKEEEVTICSKFMGPLLSYYLENLRALMESLFEKWNIVPHSLHTVHIIPVSVIKRKNVKHFYNVVDNLSVECPVASNTILKNDGVVTYFIFNRDYIYEFQKDISSNKLERFIIAELLSSLIKFYEQKSIELASSEAWKIVEKYIPNGPKLHSLDSIPVENPILPSYTKPIKFNDICVNRVQKQIATFLHDKSIKIGIHAGSKAKEICNKIFLFLFKELSGKLSKYNEHQIIYIYRQIELIEGERENIDRKAGLQSKIPTTYDLEADYEDNMREIRDLAVITKYILQISLSVENFGKKTLAETEWYELQAIGYWINYISLMSDSLHFEIAENKLEITDMYEIKIIRENNKFDTEAFSRANNIKTIAYNAKSVTKRKNHTIKKDKTNSEPNKWLPLLDNAFIEEYKFRFTDLLFVLKEVSHIKCDSFANYPVLIQEKKKLMKKIADYCIVNPAQPLEYKAIIDFLTIRPIDINNPILPSQIDSLKNRINLCPFIEVDDQIVWGNQLTIKSGNLWSSLIGAGLNPYKLSSKSEIFKVLKKIHKHYDKELENEAFGVVTRVLGEKYCERNIDNFRRISQAFPAKPSCGEIDVLAINPDRKIIYIFDAKNSKRGRTYSGIDAEHKKFFKSKGHYYHLSQKADFVKENIDVFLKYFSIEDKNGWNVIKAFIVRDNYVSAFKKDNPVDFVLINDLKDYIG